MMLSVVIPSRDGASLLRRYLPSVLGELSDLGEVVVVDDGSSDDTEEALRELADSRLRRIRRRGENGFCYAVNRGMDEARGELLLLLNNDVEPVPGCFGALVEAGSRASGDIAAIVPEILRPNGRDEGGCVVRMRRGLPVTALSGPGVPYPSGAASLFTADSWRRLGGMSSRFAPIYWEDVDIGLRGLSMGLRVVRVPGASVRHQHAATMGSSLASQALRERNRMILAATSPVPGGWRASFRIWLPFHLISARLAGNRAFLMGYSQFRRRMEALS